MKRVIINLGLVLSFGTSLFASDILVLERIESEKLTKEERIQYCKQVGNSIVSNDESYKKYKEKGSIDFINLIKEVQLKQLEIFKKNKCYELLK